MATKSKMAIRSQLIVLLLSAVVSLSSAASTGQCSEEQLNKAKLRFKVNRKIFENDVIFNLQSWYLMELE